MKHCRRISKLYMELSMILGNLYNTNCSIITHYNTHSLVQSFTLFYLLLLLLLLFLLRNLVRNDACACNTYFPPAQLHTL